MDNKQKRWWIERSLGSWKAIARVPGHEKKKSTTASTKWPKIINSYGHQVVKKKKNVQQSTHNLYPTQCTRVWQARYLYLPLTDREGFLGMKSEPLCSLNFAFSTKKSLTKSQSPITDSDSPVIFNSQ